MVKNKTIFLDRDGTLNKDYGYVYQKEKLEFLPGVIKGLKELSNQGYKLIIITNQSGIARGYFSLEQYNDFNNYFLNKLHKENILIDKVYCCPHKDEDNCECRKPKLGLFYKAIKEFNVDLDNSYAVGDKIRDLSICDETNIKGIILDNSIKSSYFIATTFDDVVKYILNSEV